jgi:hypothetical protein
MRVVLLALHDNTSDRESARRVRMDLGRKHAPGLPLDHPGFHATTFSVFRSRIVLHAKAEQLFRRVVVVRWMPGCWPSAACSWSIPRRSWAPER